MSKIFEALEHAYRTRKVSEGSCRLPDTTSAVNLRNVVHDLPHINMKEEMFCLYKNIETVLPEPSKKMIQFIGSQEGEGTSTVAREFARFTAEKIGKKILLIDGDRLRPCQNAYFNLASHCGWQDVIRKGELTEKAFQQVGESSLFVSPSANVANYTPDIFYSPEFEDFCNRTQERFDMVIIDSPPLAGSPDGLAIAPKVSGVAIVLEAEKTRWHMAKNSVERIRKVGGAVVGIVFNKRHNHVPDFIHRRL